MSQRSKRSGKQPERRERRPGDLSLSKRDVVRRELSAAIRLFFADGDPVAIHVLTSAAAAILHAVGSANGKVTTRGDFLERIAEEHRGQVRAAVDQAYNFMKHGARDADETYDLFNPEINALLIATSTVDYWRVFGETFIDFGIFNVYMATVRPELFTAEGIRAAMAMAEPLKRLAESEIIDRPSALRAIAEADMLEAFTKSAAGVNVLAATVPAPTPPERL